MTEPAKDTSSHRAPERSEATTKEVLEELAAAEALRRHAVEELVARAEAGDFEAEQALSHAYGRIAVYPGSFDPLTLGHKDVIRRSAALFDEVVVAIGINPDKKSVFTIEERIAMIKADLEDVPGNIRVVAFEGALIDFADSIGARAIVRGVREVTDFAYETNLALINLEQTDGEVETLFLPATPEISFVSSTVAKDLVRLDLDLHNYLTPATANALKAKLLVPRLEKSWNSACDELGIAAGPERERMFKEVVAAYGEPQRAYHDLVHIYRMILGAEPILDKIKDKGIFLMSIFFHDKVYDPRRTDNEEKSSVSCSAWLHAQNVPAERVQRCEHQILATKSHRVAPGDFDAEVLLDLDLAIFSTLPRRYDRYAAGIHKEYEHIEQGLRASTRKSILEMFAAREQIYFHPELLKLSPEKARKNLLREAASLAPAAAEFAAQREKELAPALSPWQSKVVALTGSIGCGKSSVLDELQARGAYVISADELVNELKQPGQAIYARIVAEFGSGILDKDGTIDNGILGPIVFADEAKRHRLEEIVHPAVMELAEKRFREEAAKGNTFLVFEVPLLFEGGFDKMGFKTIVVVTAEREVTIQRIQIRNPKLTREQIEARIDAQMNIDEKVRRGDIIIPNNGTKNDLKAMVGAFVPTLKKN